MFGVLILNFEILNITVMASISETGHWVNISNFGVLIERLEEFGVAYDPENEDISIANLRSKLSVAEALHREYIVAHEKTKIPINERELLFGRICKIAVRALNVYVASNATKASIADVRGFVNKLTGRYVRVKRLEDGSRDPKHVSNSRQGYVQKAEHFHMLVELLRNDVHYAPKEVHLQIGGLEGLLGEANDANDCIGGLEAKVAKKRLERDHALYDLGTGLCDLALACKSYVRGVYGPGSPEARSVVGIRLRRFYRMG